MTELAKALEGLSAANLDCLTKRLPGEPMFILLGRDPDAGNIVRLWAERRHEAGDPDHAAPVYGIADAMDEWAKTHTPNTAPPKDAYRTGQLVPAQSGDVEAVARALAAASNENWDAKDFTQTLSGEAPDEMRAAYRYQATAAIAAMTSAKDAEIARLREALHDAIRRPMGQVPESAEPFYSPAMAEQAEARRVIRALAERKEAP